MDVVLTEGYKRGVYPKIEVHRTARSESLICSPEELTAIVSDRDWELGVPRFDLDDVAGVADLIATAVT